MSGVVPVKALSYLHINLPYICTNDILKHMRTTLNIDDELLKRVKKKAAVTGKTMTQIVEEALLKEVAGVAEKPGRFKLDWVTVEGPPAPGVDLSDRDSLYDTMEHRR